MKKGLRIISLALSCIIILGFVSLSYGADFDLITGAAFGYSKSDGIKDGTSDTKATTADPITVSPATSNGMQYYFNGTSITNLGSIGTSISSWGSMVGALTQAFAYSARGIATAIQNSSTITWPTVSYYFSPTTSDNGANVNFSVGSASSFAAVVNQISEFFREVWRYEYRMGKYLMPDFNSYNYNGSDWLSLSASYLDTNGDRTATTISQESAFLQLRNLTRYTNNTTTNGFYRLIGQTLGTNQTTLNQFFSPISGNNVQYLNRSLWADIRVIWYYLSASLRNIIMTPSSFTLTDYANNTSTVSPHSMYDYLTMFGANISQSLGRLAFVLANDEDIALRQQTQDQQNAYKTNFTASGASARMSTSDIGTASDSVSELKSAFTSSASARDAFNGFSSGTDGRWNWFSTEILNSLDTTTNNRKSYNLTNFLDDYYNEVLRYAD